MSRNDSKITPARFYSVEQVAAIYQVHAQTVRTWVRSKQLQAVRVGSLIRIPEAALRAFEREIVAE